MRRPAIVLLPVLLLGCPADITAPTGKCSGPQPFTVGGAVSAAIGTDDCEILGEFGDAYQLTLTGQTNFRVTVTPSGFDAKVAVRAGNASTPASSTEVFGADGAGPIGATAFLPAGSYFILVGSSNRKTGTYRLDAQPASADGCGSNWTYPGADLSGTVTTGDCEGALSARQDIYQVQLKRGQAVAVSATLSRNGAVLWRTGSASSADLVTKVLPQGGSTAFTFTAASDGTYRLHMLGEPSTTGVVTYSATIR